MTDALDAARLVGRAANGDEWAQARLADLYRELIRATSGDFRLSALPLRWRQLLEPLMPGPRVPQPGREEQ